MSATIELTGWNIPRLLSAFQAMEMTACHDFDVAYGVSNRQACKIVEELTGIKPKGKGKIKPEKWGTAGDVLEQYMQWLIGTGEHLNAEVASE